MSDQASVCKVCGLSAEEGYAMPLCSPCRKKLSERPFPRWIQVVAVALAPCILLALFQFPSHLEAGIAFERGHRAEGQGRYAEALTQYSKALGRFPGSDTIAVRNCVSLYHAGRYLDAARAYQALEEKKLPKDDVDELNALGDDLFKKATQIQHNRGVNQ